jgi:hypothetical protein
MHSAQAIAAAPAPHPLRAALAHLPLGSDRSAASDLKLFLTAYVGGLVFFGILFA